MGKGSQKGQNKKKVQKKGNKNAQKKKVKNSQQITEKTPLNPKLEETENKQEKVEEAVTIKVEEKTEKETEPKPNMSYAEAVRNRQEREAKEILLRKEQKEREAKELLLLKEQEKIQKEKEIMEALERKRKEEEEKEKEKRQEEEEEKKRIEEEKKRIEEERKRIEEEKKKIEELQQNSMATKMKLWKEQKAAEKLLRQKEAEEKRNQQSAKEETKTLEKVSASSTQPPKQRQGKYKNTDAKKQEKLRLAKETKKASNVTKEHSFGEVEQKNEKGLKSDEKCVSVKENEKLAKSNVDFRKEIEPSLKNESGDIVEKEKASSEKKESEKNNGNNTLTKPSNHPLTYAERSRLGAEKRKKREVEKKLSENEKYNQEQLKPTFDNTRSAILLNKNAILLTPNTLYERIPIEPLIIPSEEYRPKQVYTRNELLASRDKYKKQPENFPYFARALSKFSTYTNPNEKVDTDSPFVKKRRLINSLLNKLTNLNVNEIAKTLSVINLFYVYEPENESLLLSFCESVFTKGSIEKKLTSAYVELLHNLFSILEKDKVIKIKRNLVESIEDRITGLFQHFEESEQEEPSPEKKNTYFDEDDIYLEHKKEIDKYDQYTGACFFIGKLFAGQVITFRTVINCLDLIFPREKTTFSDATLCSVLDLISTAGPQIEHITANAETLATFEDVFNRLASLIPKVPLRIRFRIEEILQRKANNWKRSENMNSQSIVSSSSNQSDENLINSGFNEKFQQFLSNSSNDVETEFADLFESAERNEQLQMLEIVFNVIISQNSKTHSIRIIKLLQNLSRKDVIEKEQVIEATSNVLALLLSKDLDLLMNAGSFVAHLIFQNVFSFSDFFALVFQIRITHEDQNSYGDLLCCVLRELIVLNEPIIPDRQKRFSFVRSLIDSCKLSFTSLFSTETQSSFEALDAVLGGFELRELFPELKERRLFLSELKSEDPNLELLTKKAELFEGEQVLSEWNIDCFKIILHKLDASSPTKASKDFVAFMDILKFILPSSSTVEVQFPCLDIIIDFFASYDIDLNLKDTYAYTLIELLLKKEIITTVGLLQWNDLFSEEYSSFKNELCNAFVAEFNEEEGVN